MISPVVFAILMLIVNATGDWNATDGLGISGLKFRSSIPAGHARDADNRL